MVRKKVTMYINGAEAKTFELKIPNENERTTNERVKNAIIEALNGGKVFNTNDGLKNIDDWSDFGADGNMIKIEDVE